MPNKMARKISQFSFAARSTADALSPSPLTAKQAAKNTNGILIVQNRIISRTKKWENGKGSKYSKKDVREAQRNRCQRENND